MTALIFSWKVSKYLAMNFSSQKLDERVHVHVQTPHVVQNYQCAAIGHKAAGLRSSFRHSRQDQMSKMNISQLMYVTKC